MLAGMSQREAARRAGVSVRTWRRWEQRGHRLAEAWLRYECGMVPGWPRGWRIRPEGVQRHDGHLVPIALIEAAPWLLGLLEPADRAAAYRRISAS